MADENLLMKLLGTLTATPPRMPTMEDRTPGINRPPQIGWEDHLAHALLIPETPLDVGMMAMGGPFGKLPKILSLAAGGIATASEAQAGKLGAVADAASGAVDKIAQHAQALRKYYSQRTWPDAETAKADILRKIERENANTNSFFPPTDPKVLDHFEFVKRGNGVKVSQAGLAPPRPAFQIFDEPTGTYPRVDFTARDMMHKGSPESAFKSYGRGIGEAREGYVNATDLPKPKLAGGETGYGWEEIRQGGTYPAPTIRVNKNGTVSIMDGNHRIHHWLGEGYDQIPAFIIDERVARGKR